MDAAQLLAEGTTAVLADGSTLHVRFDFEALLRLEVGYGSIFQWADDLARKPLGCVVAAFQAVAPARNITAASLDSTRLTEYRRAVLEAWLEAMPAASASKEGDEGKAAGGSGTGEGSTPSPPSPADAPTPSFAG